MPIISLFPTLIYEHQGTMQEIFLVQDEIRKKLPVILPTALIEEPESTAPTALIKPPAVTLVVAATVVPALTPLAALKLSP